MEFVASREFRINPGKVWKMLKDLHKLIITSNGKPIAMLSDIEGRNLEENIKAEAMAECAMAVTKLREHALKKGLDALSEEDVEKEIARARKNS